MGRARHYCWPMSDAIWTGGCLCGAVRYEARGEPMFMGYCFCTDCRKASGSGFVPFMVVASGAVQITGAVLVHTLRHADGREAVRNACAVCGGLVYGGEVGKSDGHTIYAGSLDDPSLFKPSMAIFTRDKPDWVVLPPGLALFDGQPS
jgi:hypothetical protein